MLVCTNCHATQLQGSVFCAECGATLGLVPPAAPVPAPAPVTITKPIVAPAPPAAANPTKAAAAPRLTLVVIQSGHRLAVNTAPTLPTLIGRRDDARGVLPGVDLGEEGGYDAGVSRTHASVLIRDATYYVEDLHSSNGTFVNGQAVAPAHPVPLAHGDELRCGMLHMRVELAPS